MPSPTEPVKKVCYADNIECVGVRIPDLEESINSHQAELSSFLRDNSLLISAPKSTVTLFTPDPAQAKLHPRVNVAGVVNVADSPLPLERSPKILGLYLDTTPSYHHHCSNLAGRVSRQNNILKFWPAPHGDSQKAVGKSTIDYGAPVWSINSCNTRMNHIQAAQNADLRLATGSHQMSSIAYLHHETKMLKVQEHQELLSV